MWDEEEEDEYKEPQSQSEFSGYGYTDEEMTMILTNMDGSGDE